MMMTSSAVSFVHRCQCPSPIFCNQSAVFVVGSWDPAERFSSLSLDFFWNNLIARVHRLGLFVGTTTELGIGFHPRLLLCSLLHLIALGSFLMWGYLSSTHVDFGILAFSAVVGFIPRFFVAFAS
jgi:hypothetical protein